MLISEDDYNNFWGWMRKYIHNNCIFHSKKNFQTDWNIDHREDKSWMAEKHNSFPSNPNGKKYSWQFYIRRGCFDATFNSVLAQMFIYKVEREIGHFDFQISGLETAATPMLSAIPLVAKGFGIDLNSFVVKKEQKQYGIRNWIEGCPNPDLPVMIIDDLISSSHSMLMANKILQEKMNLKTMDYVFGIINKRSRFVENLNLNNSTTHCLKMPDKKILYFFDCDDFNLYARADLAERTSPEFMEELAKEIKNREEDYMNESVWDEDD